MANSVLIIGPSGSGKSSSIRTLDPKTTFIIAPDRKALPIRGWRSNYVTVRNDKKEIDFTKSNYVEINEPVAIKRLMDYISVNRPDIKTIVIDTLNHAMTAEFMRKINVAGFGKWSEFALAIYNICNVIPDLRQDLTVIVTGHNEMVSNLDGTLSNRLKTLGKLLEEKITVESLFTTVLFSFADPRSKDLPYGFHTQSDGGTTAKSPMGLFDSTKIPNDLAFVLDKLAKYES